MHFSEFRIELERRLRDSAGQVLLRVALAPGLDHPVELTGPQILQESMDLVRRYVTAPERSVVLLLLPHSLELFLLHLGCILTGRVPAVLAWPTSRMDPEKYQRNLLHQLRNLPADQLVTLPRLVENLAPSLPFPAVACPLEGHAQFERSFAARLPLEPFEPPPLHADQGRPSGEALFLQFSGGTTGAQKAVVVTADMLTRQLALLAESLELTADDSIVSWLPLYHDMGLIACLWFPLWQGVPSLQFSASDWLLNPELLFTFITRYRGTFCWLPNFAFSYLASQRERMKGPQSLDSMRGFVNCSEPVRLRSMRSFWETFSDWGVSAGQCVASYAMAENVFAVTQSALGAPPKTIVRSLVRQKTTAYGDLAFDLIDDVYVSSGTALRTMEVRIAGPQGELGDGEPGEIQLRTSCQFQGYWGQEGFVTSSISESGWYSTGDFGFLHEGELYVIGRLKDIVIVAGQNVFPEDVEGVVNGVEGIYPGRVVSFGVPDEQYETEALAVIAELRGNYEEEIAARLQRQIQQQVLAAIGIAPRYVKVVPERWIVKSTAGKISRKETRMRFLEERARQLA